MAKKSRSAIAKKAWITRKANATKKRGVKPGTKRGPYKRPGIVVLSRKQAVEAGWNVSENQVGPVKLSLCQQLEETITRFENRISNSIGRLNELMGKV